MKRFAMIFLVCLVLEIGFLTLVFPVLNIWMILGVVACLCALLLHVLIGQQLRIEALQERIGRLEQAAGSGAEEQGL